MLSCISILFNSFSEYSYSSHYEYTSEPCRNTCGLDNTYCFVCTIIKCFSRHESEIQTFKGFDGVKLIYQIKMQGERHQTFVNRCPRNNLWNRTNQQPIELRIRSKKRKWVRHIVRKNYNNIYVTK